MKVISSRLSKKLPTSTVISSNSSTWSSRLKSLTLKTPEAPLQIQNKKLIPLICAALFLAGCPSAPLKHDGPSEASTAGPQTLSGTLFVEKENRGYKLKT